MLLVLVSTGPAAATTADAPRTDQLLAGIVDARSKLPPLSMDYTLSAEYRFHGFTHSTRLTNPTYAFHAAFEDRAVTLNQKLRMDGERFDAQTSQYVRSLVYDGGIEKLDSVSRRVWDGNQSQQLAWYKPLDSDDPLARPPHLTVSKRSSPTEYKQRALPAKEVITGFFSGDEEPYYAILKHHLDSVSILGYENIDGHECAVVEAQIPSGKYKLWVDPEAGYNLRKAHIEKSESDTFYGAPTLSNGYMINLDTEDGDGWFTGVYEPGRTARAVKMIIDVDNVRISEQKGHYFASGGNIIERIEFDTGHVIEQREVVTAQQIQVDPDFDALGAFKVDIPEGTIIRDSDLNLTMRWRNGQSVLVPSPDEVEAISDAIGEPLSTVGSAAPDSKNNEITGPDENRRTPPPARRPKALFIGASLVILGLLLVLSVRTLKVRRC